MVVDLIAGEKQEIRVQLFDILDKVCPGNIAAVTHVDRIAGKGCHDDFVLVDRIAAHQTFIRGNAIEGDHAKRLFARMIPIIDAEMGRPG